MAITFYPRILGKDTINDEVTTTVDISKNYSMQVTVSKTAFSDYETRKVYLNGIALTPTSVNDQSSLYFLNFENFTFVRGNPNGHINGEINRIEYKL